MSKDRMKGDITGCEEQVDEIVEIAEKLKELENRKRQLESQVRAEVDPLVIEQERVGKSVHTLNVPGSKTAGVQVIYSSQSKALSEYDKMRYDEELPYAQIDEVLEDHTEITLKGDAAKRFLEESEKIDLYPDVDHQIVVKEARKLRKDFLSKRAELRKVFGEKNESLLDEISRDYLYKPSFKVKKEKKES